MSTDAAMRGDAEYEGLKKKSEINLIHKAEWVFNSCTQLLKAEGEGQPLRGGCCFDTNQEREMESWALPGNATRSESLRAGAEPTSHPESPPSPSTRSTGLGLSSWWEPSPLPPLSRPLLPGQHHDVSDPIQPKDLKAHFGEGDAAKARMELPPACQGGQSQAGRCPGIRRSQEMRTCQRVLESHPTKHHLTPTLVRSVRPPGKHRAVGQELGENTSLLMLLEYNG